MASLYIMRHGETLFNVQHKTQGWCDSPLTERGIEQARIAGRTLAERGITFDRFYSSTSERCCDTLELAVEAGWGFIPQYERRKGLREFGFGAFEAKDQFLEKFPHGDFYADYGGETQDGCLERFLTDLHTIMERGDKSVFVLSSGGVSITLFHALVPKPEPGTVPFGNCICYHYEYEPATREGERGTLKWVEHIVPDFSALEAPGLDKQVSWH
ncbi:MAG: histidine phosphatase family protein [Coriobacteriales bacterium]|nr:histidine phosphatase family protein [Coriobacteriales bacterium]